MNMDSLPEFLFVDIVSFLPAYCTARAEAAGGLMARTIRNNHEEVWRPCLENFEWLVSATLPHGEKIKQYVLKLTAKRECAVDTLRAASAGHFLMVGGNIARNHFAEEPVTDVTAVRDAPPMHHLSETEVLACQAGMGFFQRHDEGEAECKEGGSVEYSFTLESAASSGGGSGSGSSSSSSSSSSSRALVGRAMIQSLPAELLEARSTCAAVRRPTDGAVLALCGWDGEEALASCEELRFTNGVPPYGAPNKVVASWEWRSIPSTSVARCYVAGAADAAGIIWLMGGGSTLWQGALTYDSTEFLRPYTGSVEWGYGVSDDDDDDDEGGSSGGGEGGGQAEWSWQKGPKMTAQRCGHGAVCDYVRGGGIYSVGGYGGGMLNKTDVFFFYVYATSPTHSPQKQRTCPLHIVPISSTFKRYNLSCERRVARRVSFGVAARRADARCQNRTSCWNGV
jgi:hypothetical protein